MKIDFRLLFGPLSAAAILATSCAQPTTREAASPDGTSASRGPTTLRVGTTREQTDGVIPSAGTATGFDFRVTLHSGLTMVDGAGTLHPRLATKVPTVEDGDWKLDPSGKMEVVWRLQPNATWHDGTALSASDFVFGWKLKNDRDLPYSIQPWLSLVDSVVATDPKTLTVTWKSPYIRANESSPGDFAAVPEHILGELYDSGEKQGVINSSYWTSEFVGLGPYRQLQYVVGSHLEAQAYEGYFLGRPRIDKIVFRFYTDANPMVAALLAGDIDYIMMNSIKTQQIKDIQGFWEPTKGGTTIQSIEGLRLYYLQYRDANAPWQDARVRRALVHSVDRQAFVDTLEYGMAQVADTLPSPDDPVYGVLEQKGLARYPYDLRRAEQLLNESGWTKGANGRFQNAAGQPFNIEVRTVATTPASLPEISAMSDAFSAAGLASDVYPIPNGATNAPELRALSPGTFANTLENGPESLSAFLGDRVATEQNRWRGNLFGYSNPSFDRLYNQYATTIPIGARNDLLATALKLFADEAVFIPMWYSTGSTNIAFRKGIAGPGPTKGWHQATMWNVHTWTME